MFDVSSGNSWTSQPFPGIRSLGKSSLVTPISTLAPSPENSSHDLFCAFQPNRVMVWSLPFVLKWPRMPSLDLCDAVPAKLDFSVASGVFSMNPTPKVGEGMRKATLFSRTCVVKSGCAREQPPGASLLPWMLKSGRTAPAGNPSPWGLTKRASRTGPFETTNGGREFCAPLAVATATCGLVKGLVPPIAGNEWHMKQLSPLKAGPKPRIEGLLVLGGESIAFSGRHDSLA